MSENPSSFVEKAHLPISPGNLEIKAETKNIRDALEQEIKREYTPHVLDNPKIETKRCPQLGRAVFAREKIRTGEVITMFVGPIHRAKKISDLPNDPPDYMRDHVIQIGEEEYLHGKGGLAELINHSCDPNCGIKGKSMIVAMKDIPSGEQLTWDYAMTEDSDWYFPGCLCGSSECSGTIGPYRDLSDEKRKIYEPYTSKWLLEKYKPPQLKITTNIEHIPEEQIQKVIELFRFTFSNDWPQYAVCPPCDSSQPHGMRFKASEVYQTHNQPVPVFAQEQKPLIPDCPCCQQPMVLYMDPQKTSEKIRKKLEKDAILTTIENEQNGELLGFTFGRKWTLREAFEAEEWQHPYAYTENPNPKYARSFEDFQTAVTPAIRQTMTEAGIQTSTINGDTEIFLHNCTVTHPLIRGKKIMPQMMHEFQSAVPESMRNIPVIGETDKNSRFERILQSNGSLSVGGFLHPSLVLMVAHHGTSIRNFARATSSLHNEKPIL